MSEPPRKERKIPKGQRLMVRGTKKESITGIFRVEHYRASWKQICT